MVDSQYKNISSYTTPSPSSERRGKSRKVIAIVGPTASGKTGIGVKLAKEFSAKGGPASGWDGAEIVSADSRQVYFGLDLGTGKEGEPSQRNTNNQETITKKIPNPKIQIPKFKANNNFTAPNPSLERRGIEQLRSNLRYIDDVPQWMIDIVEPGEKMTLFDYLPLARLAIEDIFSRGKLPIIVGGTGLYVQGLVEGFELEQTFTPASCPVIPAEAGIQDSLTGSPGTTLSPRLGSQAGQAAGPEDDKLTREHLDKLTVEQLNDIISKLDPDKVKTVDAKNRHRLIRAIELAQGGLRPTKVKPDFETLQIAIDLPRQELFDRIDRRVDERFEQGMLEEVQSLLDQGISSDWLLSLGLEYKLITQFLVSGITYNVLGNKSHNTLYEIRNTAEFMAMSQDLKYKIHQFARRQLTWLRRFPEINWLTDYKEMERFAKIFLSH